MPEQRALGEARWLLSKRKPRADLWQVGSIFFAALALLPVAAILIILLLAGFGIFLYLAMGYRRDPERQKQFYLFSALTLWFAGVFLYLIIAAIFDW